MASSKTAVGKAYYAEFTDDQKKYISALETPAALRCYLLISSIVEESETECNYAIDKAEKVLSVLSKDESSFLESEKALLQYDKNFVAKMHPSWDLYPLPWEEKKEADKPEGEDKK